MICDTKKMALRVATAGARKMTGEGYTFEAFTGGGNVRKPGQRGYAVVLPTEELRGDCNCAFFRENWDFGTCKHIVWAGWQVDALSAQALRDAEEDRIADEASARMEAAEFMAACQAEHRGGYGY